MEIRWFTILLKLNSLRANFITQLIYINQFKNRYDLMYPATLFLDYVIFLHNNCFPPSQCCYDMGIITPDITGILWQIIGTNIWPTG